MWRLCSSKIVRFVLPPILSLWVAGAGCLMGCEGMVVAAATDSSVSATQHLAHTPTIVASGHACASGQSHNCCKKSSNKAATRSETDSSATTPVTTNSFPSGLMNGCPLALSRAAVVTKAQGADLSAFPALTHSTLPAESLLDQKAALSPPVRLPNRGHTYLRCCVFLI